MTLRNLIFILICAIASWIGFIGGGTLILMAITGTGIFQ